LATVALGTLVPPGSRQEDAIHTPTSWKALWPVAIPLLAYCVGVIALGNWIIDDAGISYAYARNLAEGHGLVSQPGRAAVEGFSNFLWVVLFVPAFWLRVFDPVWLPKLMGAMCVAGSLALILDVMRRETGRRWPGLIAALLIAASPPIVIWTASGLENGLLLLLVVSQWTVLVRRPLRWELSAGVLAAAIAMTRPDGMVFAAAPPMVALAERFAGHATLREALVQSLRAVAAFAALFGPFLLFRLVYFGLPLPHTYYAKLRLGHDSVGERLDGLLAAGGTELLQKLLDLARGIAGPTGPLLLGSCLLLAIASFAMRRLPRHGVAALVLLSLGTLAFVWLSDDWMREYRFATPALAMAWVLALSVANQQFELPGRLRTFTTTAFAGAVFALLLPGFGERVVRYAQKPATPYAAVEREYALRFNAYAQSLKLRRASVLIADTGAMLVASQITVYDMAGLFEPAIVHTLRKHSPLWHRHHPEFYSWVFDEIKPTFIACMAFFSNVTNFGADSRFARDYIALDGFPDGYTKRVYRRDVISGVFVRRDALGSPDDLQRLRASYVPAPRSEPLVYRWSDWLGRRFGPPDFEAAALSDALTRSDTHRAAHLLQAALQRNPGDLAARQKRAELLDSTGRTLDSHEEWRRLEQLAITAGAAGPLAKARRRLGTDSQAAREAEQLFRAGVLAAQQERLDDAVAAYRRSVELNSDHASAQNNLGFTLARLGRYQDAVPPLERAVQLDPRFGLAKANLRWAKAALDRTPTLVTGSTEQSDDRRTSN
jgi:hypothetical protein